MRLNLLDPPGVVPVKLVGKLHYLGPESVGVGKGSATNSFGQFLKKMIMINKLHRPANCWKSSLPFWIDEFLAAQRWLEPGVNISCACCIENESIAVNRKNFLKDTSRNLSHFMPLIFSMNWYFIFAYALYGWYGSTIFISTVTSFRTCLPLPFHRLVLSFHCPIRIPRNCWTGHQTSHEECKI